MGRQAEARLAVLGVQYGAGVMVKVQLVALKRGRNGVRLGCSTVLAALWSRLSMTVAVRRGEGALGALCANAVI